MISCKAALELAQLQPENGEIAQCFGRLAAGDGVYLYRFDALCTAEANGGTVLQSALPNGRWRLCHGGVVDFRAFGIFGPDTPADAALDAMVQDATIQRIEAWTDLNFTERHKFCRSNLTLDFGGHTLTTRGIAPAAHNDPFSAVMHFCGETRGLAFSLCLPEALPELYDIFPVPDSDAFPLYSWWQISVNHLAGREEKEIDKLVQVTEQIDKTHVRINYKMGWPLSIGRTLTYQRIFPVERVHVQNFDFYGNAGGEAVGAQPLALEYAVRCDVRDVHGYHTYWPVLLRRHNTEYVTERCSLVNPVEVVVGGTGYLTQQIHCLYGKVRDCTASNARHLNDFTGCAYCMAENNHCDGDFHGAFVTHGQFEHDLTFVGNSGLLSFANSGPTWGSSAKRITVKRHSGCWGIAFAKVSDLTLEDVTIEKTEKYAECGTFLCNADGLQMRGCTADQLVLTQRSARSKRPNVIRDCAFRDGIVRTQTGDGAVSPDTEILLENNC
ncbi:MAG: hypothetical protein RSC73_02040 [Ruthenibacterium sp.]